MQAAMAFLAFEGTLGIPAPVGLVGLARFVGNGQVEDLDVAQVLAAQIDFRAAAQGHVPYFPYLRTAIRGEGDGDVHIVHLVLCGCGPDRKDQRQQQGT